MLQVAWMGETPEVGSPLLPAAHMGDCPLPSGALPQPFLTHSYPLAFSSPPEDSIEGRKLYSWGQRMINKSAGEAGSLKY